MSTKPHTRILFILIACMLPLILAPSARAVGTTLDFVDLGDPASESGHAMAGWGPIEPATSGGAFGGIDHCRPVYAPEDGDDWATIELDFGDDPTTCKLLTVRHLDGHSEDTFDLFLGGVLVHSYGGDGLTTEHWYTLELDACFTGLQTLEFVSTAPQWSGWATYGQMCIDTITVEEPAGACTLLDLVDVGDTDSEAGHALAGWGPVEPATSGGNYGGIEDCRAVYALEDGDDHATLELDFGDDLLSAKCLTIHHLEGLGLDSFDLFIHPTGHPSQQVRLLSYPGDAQTDELWLQTSLPVHGTGPQTLTFVSTAPQWSGWSTYGQMCIDLVRVDACPPVRMSVDIGDPDSEAGHGLVGWGPVEPATSGGSYGGIDHCRAVYAPEDGDDWASLDVDLGCCGGSKCLTMRHLDGLGNDSFDVYVHPVGAPAEAQLIFSYPGDGLAVEVWKTSSVIFEATGRQTLKFVSTDPQWSGWATYGQMCFDEITVSEVTPVLDAVVIGDPASEAGHAMTGWGPVEPATSGGSYGGIDRCRAIYAPEDGDVAAAITLDFGACVEGTKSLTLEHLDGIASDAFDVYIYAPGETRPDTPFWSYGGDDSTQEIWFRTSLAAPFSGPQVVELVSTEPAWDQWDVYGQVCFGCLRVQDCSPCDPTPFRYATVDVGQRAPGALGRITSIAPNPFNPKTEISFVLNAGCETELAVYDVRGQKVATLVDGPLAAGSYMFAWHGQDAAGQRVSSGVYFARLSLGDGHVQVEKVSLIK